MHSLKCAACELGDSEDIRAGSGKVLRTSKNSKMVKTPYNWVIFPLTQPQVANQQQKNIIKPMYMYINWQLIHQLLMCTTVNSGMSTVRQRTLCFLHSP